METIFLVDVLSFGAMLFIGGQISHSFQIGRIIDWVLLAILLGIVFMVVSFIINIIFYKEIVIGEVSRIKEIVKH